MIPKVLSILIVSDFLLQAGWGLIGPIFAIFLTKQIEGGSIAMVGFIAATFWITKSLVQPFFAYHLDSQKGEKDDFLFLVIGMYVASLIPLGYFVSTTVFHIFALEFIRGIALAAVFPSWYGIFTRHISKGWEAFSWSIESTSLGLAAGFAAALGGILTSILGFRSVFILVAILGLLSSSTLLLLRNKIFPRDHSVPSLPPKDKLSF